MAKKKAKSAAVVAKESELAREAELLRLQQVQERIRNEELQIRQRIEEEEHKLLEHLRIREQTIANAIAERGRQVRFDAMEKELMETAERKDRDIQELRAKVLGQQVAQEDLERERESALRRAAMLNNELELVQMKYIECQAQMVSQEKSYEASNAQLVQQYDELQVALSSLRATHENLLKQHQALQDEVAKKAVTTSPVSEKLTPDEIVKMDVSELSRAQGGVDTETTVLLKVLHGEVSKYKEKALQLQAELDSKLRDDEKSSLLVGILNTQLDSVREDQKRLHATAQNRQKEVETVQLFLNEEKKKTKELCEQLDRATSEATVQQRQLQLEVGVHKAQVEELTNRLAEIQHEHQLLEAEHKDTVLRSTAREQEDFKTNVAMKSELLKQKEDLAKVLQEKQAMQEEGFQYKVLTRAEMDSLKVRLRKFEEEMERKERESYETTSVLRSDVEKLKNEKKLLLDFSNVEKARLTDDLERYHKSLNQVQRELEELKRHSTHVQKDLYEKLTHMTACHDSKHEEVVRLRSELEKKETEYTNNAIFLNAKCENYRSTIESMEKESEARRLEHLTHVESIAQELMDLQTNLSRELKEMDVAKKAQEDRADQSERQVHRLQEEVRRLLSKVKELSDTKAEEAIHHNRELRELQHELSLAKRTIVRLEGTIGDQAGFKQVIELNEKLSEENQSLQKQVSNLNSTIAGMKMESDYLKDLRVNRMGEEMNQLRLRNNQLEYLHKLTIPLLTELRHIVQQHGITRAMQTALEKYDINVARAQLETNNEGDLLGVVSTGPVPTPPASVGKPSDKKHHWHTHSGGRGGNGECGVSGSGGLEGEHPAANRAVEVDQREVAPSDATSTPREGMAVAPTKPATATTTTTTTLTASITTQVKGTSQSIAAVLPKMCYPSRPSGSMNEASSSSVKDREDTGSIGVGSGKKTMGLNGKGSPLLSGNTTSSSSGSLHIGSKKGVQYTTGLHFPPQRNLPPL